MDENIERASYAAVHQAISGLTKIVCIVDRLRRDEWKGTGIEVGSAIELCANDKFGDHVSVTRWRVVGPVVSAGPGLPAELVAFLKRLWPVAEWWLNENDRIWWFRAELIPDRDGWQPTDAELVDFLARNRRALELPTSQAV